MQEPDKKLLLEQTDYVKEVDTAKKSEALKDNVKD